MFDLSLMERRSWSFRKALCHSHSVVILSVSLLGDYRGPKNEQFVQLQCSFSCLHKQLPPFSPASLRDTKQSREGTVLKFNDKLLTIKINKEWSNAIPVLYGKDIVTRFSKDYCLVTMMIKGDDEKCFVRSVLGDSLCTIHAYLISHIINPRLSMKTEFESYLEATIEIREPD